MTTCDSPTSSRRFAFTGSNSSKVPTRASSACSVQGLAPTPFERLVQITRSNDQIVAELEKVKQRIGRALTYAADVTSQSNLAEALMAHARKKQAQLLDQLRANRSEALEILARATASR